MPVVTFLPSGKKIEVTQGISVLQAEQLAGIRQDAPCGGHGKCGKCKVRIQGQEVLACKTAVSGDMAVTVLSEPKDMRILAGGEEETSPACGVQKKAPFSVRPVQNGRCHIGVDIGTTTVVAYLIDGISGEILNIQSMLNPQFPYGSDVISRIQAALEGNLGELSRLIREGVWGLILKLCESKGILPETIGTVAVVANPAMQQLFFGHAPENLAKPPFEPVYTHTQVLDLEACFPLKCKGKLLVVPDMAGYVGADTMGCVLSAGMYRDSQMTLMIDIGTNGEMVLGNCDGMVACSTAAGPALEGGRIRCGMRGSAGAIDHVWLENGGLRYSVIGGGRAEGICGSGIIDLAAVLLDMGVLNKRGRIQRDYREEGKNRIYDLTENVFVTQEDIREVQMAKGAVCAGIRIMMEQLQVSLEEIDQVILCGAFGNYMRPESACRIGLIPRELLPKIKAGGNAAGMGSRLMAADREIFYLSDQLLKKTRAIELASFPAFQRIYAENMMFAEDNGRGD